MAGIDRRIARGEHRNDRRLRPFQMEGRGQICVSSDRFDVLIPRLAWIGAELLRRLAEQQVPGTFDVIGSERAAVVPFDTPAQRECQLAPVLVPRPIGGQIRDDRSQAVLRHVLLIEDEIVEDAHHRDLGRVGRLFEDRHAGRAVSMVDLENSARFLRQRRPGGEQSAEQQRGRDEWSRMSLHSHFFLPLFACGPLAGF